MDHACAIFLETTGYRDVRNDVPRCLTCKYTNANTQIQCIHKYSKLWNVRKPYEVLYFWKALGTGMCKIMFPGIWHAHTQTQKYEYEYEFEHERCRKVPKGAKRCRKVPMPKAAVRCRKVPMPKGAEGQAHVFKFGCHTPWGVVHSGIDTLRSIHETNQGG